MKSLKGQYISVSQLTLGQKLDLMEAIWDDLTKNDEILDSPDWHSTILKDRDEAPSAGKISISDWKEAKKRIKRNVTYK